MSDLIPLLAAILTVTVTLPVALGGLMLALFTWIRGDIRTLADRVDALSGRVGVLADRMSRLEATRPPA
jgi:hypothetical protein